MVLQMFLEEVTQLTARLERKHHRMTRFHIRHSGQLVPDSYIVILRTGNVFIERTLSLDRPQDLISELSKMEKEIENLLRIAETK